MKKFFITTGDFEGIGLEVTLKALQKMRWNSQNRIFIFHKPKSDFCKIEKELFLQCQLNKKMSLAVEFVERSDSPAQWVLDIVEFIKKSRDHHLITAGLSKPEFKKAGLTYLGHTQLLEAAFKKSFLQMGFLGEVFNVLLMTDHLPLSKIEKSLTFPLFKKTLANAQLMNSFIFKLNWSKPSKKSRLNWGCLGLNPHAGDKGLIGDFEKLKLSQWINNCPSGSLSIHGPLVPDASFKLNSFSSLRNFIALYHDQGLIPFKMAHEGQRSTHVTIGLPFIRTSVDHGPAFDKYGLDVANESNMKDAIEAALTLA